MKNYTKKYLALALALVPILMAFALSSCAGNIDEIPPAQNKSTLAMDYLSEIGKTLDLIKEENPGIEYQSVDIPDASGQCLGDTQGQFLYLFFGAQDFPGLMDLSTEHGHQLICAGIVSTIGEFYPETTEELPLEQFFSDNHISEYTYHLEDNPNQGWIEFYCDDYFVWINTNDSEVYSGDYLKATTMKRGYTIIFIDTEIWSDNHSIRDKYWDNYLESSH